MSKVVEIKVYLFPEQLRAIELLAARTGRGRSEVIRAGLGSFLSPDGEEQLEGALSRRLDRADRRAERLERDLTIAVEAVGLLVKGLGTMLPPVPESARVASEARGEARYTNFVQALGRRLAAGERLTKEVLEDRTAEGPRGVTYEGDLGEPN